MSRFAAPIAEQVWNMKYRYTKQDGTIIDQTVEDTWRRIAKDLASVEADPATWEDEFYGALEDWKFIPAGRIVAGAGTGRNVTLFNCFVMGTIPDSMDGIFAGLREAALTMQQGGGIGYDFSTIRPKNAPVKGVDADASGPLSFMDVWDAMCRTVMSAGSRRGAMMATMRCDHPDIEAFIDAKRDPARLRMFNVSVLVTDDFMEAVKNGDTWRLHFEDRAGETIVEKFIDARELWDKIMQGTYDCAEPGVIFIDRINKANNLWYVETIASTNPCGEQPLPPYGACLLGSINLTRFVTAPFEPEAMLDVDGLVHTVGLAVRMLDNVIDSSNFPLKAQESEAKAKRRIGLGVTGLANALMMLGARYGSDEAVEITDKIMQLITKIAYIESSNLAAEKGSFPALDVDKLLDSGFMQNMDSDVCDLIRKQGLRNSHLTSIAPTGTISLYAGNISSGIEPVFALSYTRKVLQPDGSKTEERVEDYAVKLYRELKQNWGEMLPDHFVTTETLTPYDHIRMQAVVQRWVDSSISKTVNLPETISFEDFKAVYELAYERGCKGCTTYRPNDITGSVLSIDKPKETPAPAIEIAKAAVVPARPVALDGQTYKMKWPGYPHAIYVTVNDDAEGRPFEVFFNTKGQEHAAWMQALSRTISAVFRRGGDVRFIAQELSEVYDPKGGAFIDQTYVPSMVAQIGLILEKHMNRKWNTTDADFTDQVILAAAAATVSSPQCPECGQFSMKTESGCQSCTSCGYSKCG